MPCVRTEAGDLSGVSVKAATKEQVWGDMVKILLLAVWGGAPRWRRGGSWWASQSRAGRD